MFFPPVFLHYLDRELGAGVNFRPTALSVEGITRCLLVGTTAQLYCALSLVWESPTSGGDITDFIGELVSLEHLDLFSRFHTLDGFLESKRQTYAHVRKRYPMYFRERLASDKVITPTQWKNCSTTEAVSVKLFEWAITGSAGAGKESESNIIPVLKEVIVDSLKIRDNRAVTFPLFVPQLHSRSMSEIGSVILKRQILISYCKHYLEYAQGALPTGIRGLEFFDQLASVFPYYDVAILSEIIRHIGIERLCWGNNEHLRREFSAIRNSAVHLELVRLLRMFLSGVTGVCGLSAECSASYANRVLLIQAISQILRAKGKRLVRGEGVHDILTSATDYLRNVIRNASRDPAFNEAKEKITLVVEKNKVDVLLVTATYVETEGVIAALRNETGNNFERCFIGDHTFFDLGMVAGCRVCLVQSEMGSGGPSGSLLTILDAINSLHPTFIIMVGIAFGLRREKQQLGDILVSRQLLSYELQRVGTGLKSKRLIRGDRAQATPLLLDRFRSGAIDWHKAKVHFGLIMSGEKLVDSPKFLKELLNIEPEAIGGEMEGSGLYAASIKSSASWIIIKGICDWGDGNKNDTYQQLAIGNAIDLVLHVLRQRALTDFS